MKTTQAQTVPAAAAAMSLILWNAEAEATVKRLVAAGESLPKAMMKAAPKGFVAELRAERREQLSKNTSGLLGGLSDRGFTIAAMSAIKTSKAGVQSVTLRMATPKPTASLTMAEFAKASGTTVEEIAKTFGK